LYKVYDIQGKEVHDHSVYNIAEAKFVVVLLQTLFTTHPEVHRLGMQVGVISPYKHQCRIISQQLLETAQRCTDATVASALQHVDVRTVDGFQGQQRDVIVLSTVRTIPGQIGFLRDERRMNVALTRAQISLFVVCCASALRADGAHWQALIENSEQRDRLCTITDKDFGIFRMRLPGSSSVVPQGAVPRRKQIADNQSEFRYRKKRDYERQMPGQIAEPHVSAKSTRQKKRRSAKLSGAIRN